MPEDKTRMGLMNLLDVYQFTLWYTSPQGIVIIPKRLHLLDAV